MTLRSAFIGLPSVIAREVLGAVRQNSTLVGVAECRVSSWRPVGGLGGHRSPFTAVAKRLGVEHLLVAAGITELEPLADWLRRLRVDVLCVAGMPRLLQPREFTVPPLGAINFHPSLLPRYRGPDPYYWQYHQCDLSSGVTIHRVAAGIDDGDILNQTEVKIALGDPLSKTIFRTATAGAIAIGHVLQQLRTNDLRERSQAGLSCPLFARLVPAGESPEGWLDWPLDRAWHFLRGTHQAHPFLTLPVHEQGQWRIGERDPTVRGGSGAVHSDHRGYFVAHPAGRIELLPPLKWTIVRKLKARFSRRLERKRWIS